MKQFTDTLSPRQKQVYYMVCAGKKNREIAIALGISKRSVEIHRQIVTEKAYAAGYVWRRVLVRGE